MRCSRSDIVDARHVSVNVEDTAVNAIGASGFLRGLYDLHDDTD
jgi:hypothetical protein